MATPLRVLVVEDSEADAELLELTLKHGGFAPTMKRVDSASGMSRSLEEERWDIIISDYSLPGFGGFEALQIYKSSGLDIPFILLSGVVGEDIAAEAMIRGAQDYVMKDRKARLIPAIERELRESVLRREKRESESRFRLMFETMAHGGLYQDANGRVTSANGAAERILGLSRDQLLGRTLRDPGWKVVREDGSEFRPKNQPAQVAMRTGRPVFDVVAGVYHPDEKRFYWMVVNSMPQFRPGEKKPFEVFTTLVDITERKEAEAALRESEQRYRSLADSLPTAVFEADLEGRLTYANRAAFDWFGYTDEIVVDGWMVVQMLAEVDRQRAGDSFRRILSEGIISSGEYTAQRKDGSIFPAMVTSTAISHNGRKTGLRGILVDISERKKAEETLAGERNIMHTLIDNLPDNVFIKDTQGRIILDNPAHRRHLGRTALSEVAGRSDRDFFAPELADRYMADERQIVETGQPLIDHEEPTRNSEDQPLWYLTTKVPVHDAQGTVTALVGINRDITERKQAEKALRDGEATLRSFVDALPGPASLIDMQGKALFINQTLARSLGKTADDVIGQDIVSFIPPDIAEQRWKRISQVIKTGRAARFEDSRADRSYINYINPIVDGAGQVAKIAIYSLDITERKRAENELLKSDNLLRAVIDSTPDWIFVKDMDHRYVLVNRSYARALNLEPKDLMDREDMEFWPKELCVGEPSRGVKGWHSEDLDVLSGSIMHNPDNTAVLADGTVHDFDTFKIPLRGPSGKVYGVLGYSRDVTERKNSEVTIRKSLERAEKILTSTVQAMETIVEYRDPYTAGHQERVTKLGCALAEEIGLAPDKVDNIRIGGMLHDLGKIYVPAEILSKPGKLTEFEYGILKTHPQVGYDILRSIDFPPEVAAMVAQHHERINGSGYPRGLKGEEICIEARCLAVADVMEAMSSHRPYRPALGIDVALDEISKNKGIYYDKAVAEACLLLFKEKGFTFAGKREQAVPPPKAQAELHPVVVEALKDEKTLR